MRKLTTEIKETLRSIPGLVTTIFILSCVCMNLLANKSIFNTQYLAVTAGIFFSWIAFLCMDCVCKRFGSRAATILNTTATVIALVTALIFALIVKVPGIWASVFSAPEGTGDAVNAALDGTFSSTWYIVVGSTIALFLGGLVCALAFAVDMPILLLPLGIVYLAEMLSVVLQVSYFKITHGKRLFKMSPIHHHFEMCGWSEVKIVTVFSVVTAIFGIISFVIVLLGV